MSFIGYNALFLNREYTSCLRVLIWPVAFLDIQQSKLPSLILIGCFVTRNSKIRINQKNDFRCSIIYIKVSSLFFFFSLQMSFSEKTTNYGR